MALKPSKTLERMNLNELQRKLIAAARTRSPDDHVPYAFHKRIMALLRQQAAPDPAAIWARALWRAAASCVALALLLSAWVFLATADAGQPADLEQQFENTMLAAVQQEGGYNW